jgi:hypothetical protein
MTLHILAAIGVLALLYGGCRAYRLARLSPLARSARHWSQEEGE